MNLLASVRLFHDTRRAKKDGTFPVRAEVTYKGKRKYFPSGLSLSVADFDAATGKAPRGKNRENALYLQHFLSEVQTAVNQAEPFSFDAVAKMLNAGNAPDLISDWFDKKVETSEGGTRQYYADAKVSIGKFAAKASLQEINQAWLKRYAAWMERIGNSPTTTGMYLRAVRTLLNMAIADGVMKPEAYPFGKRGFSIPKGKSDKKALDKPELVRLLSQPVPEQWDKWCDLWAFSYYCNGMNMKDILLLRWEHLDLQSKTLSFVREKTKKTSDGRKITIALPDEAVGIVQRHGDTNSPFVFGLVNGKEDGKRLLERKRQVIKLVNKYTGKRAELAGIGKNVTTYTARHTFATVLKNAGVPVAFIQEALGHTDSKTTQAYLDSFGEDKKREFAELLRF